MTCFVVSLGQCSRRRWESFQVGSELVGAEEAETLHSDVAPQGVRARTRCFQVSEQKLQQDSDDAGVLVRVSISNVILQCRCQVLFQFHSPTALSNY